MSNEFSIKNSSFLNNSWLAPIEKVFKRKDFTNYYNLDETMTQGYILGPGLISGFSVTIEKDLVSLEIQDFANLLDWQLLYECLRSLLSAGKGILYKNGDQFSVININEDEASHMYYKHMKKAINDTRKIIIKKEVDYTFLRVNDFGIKIQMADLPKAAETDTDYWSKIEKVLILQIDTYGPIHHATLEGIKTSDGEIKLCNYHHLPSIISKEANFITLNGITKSIDGMVPLDKFLEVLADEVIDLDFCYYLPEVNFHKKEDLYNSLNELRVALPLEEDIQDETSGIENEINPIEIKTKVSSLVSQIIDRFRAGESEADISFSICTNVDAEIIDKDIAHATIEVFKEVKKDPSLTDSPERLSELLLEKGLPKEFTTLVLQIIFDKMKTLKPKATESKPQKVSIEEGGDGWVLAALCAAVVMITSAAIFIF